MKNSADRGGCHPLSTSPPHPFEICRILRVCDDRVQSARQDQALPTKGHLQSNLSNTDTEGTERSVRIREVSVWKRSLPWRHFYDSTYRFKCSVAKTGLTLVFKLHLNLIHSTKTLSFSSILHCTSQLQSETVQSLTNHCFKTKRATAQCCK